MTPRGWKSQEDTPLGEEMRSELETILRAEAGLSNRLLVAADWLLDLSTRPLGRVVTSLLALTLAWALL